MKSTCEEARNWVPRALMSDLAPQEEQALNAHLAECPACLGEQRFYMRYLGPGPSCFGLSQFRGTSLSTPTSAVLQSWSSCEVWLRAGRWLPVWRS